MAVSAHAVLIQIYLCDVHSEDENGNETEAECAGGRLLSDQDQ